VPTAEPTVAPTPIPDPTNFAIANGWYFGETGFAVRDEPGAPPFFTAFGRQGGPDGIGLPVSQVYTAAGAQVQRFRNGWLNGAGSTAARGDGTPPEAPREALVREPRPEMALVGRVDVSSHQLRQGNTALIRLWSDVAQSVSASFDGREFSLVKEREGGPWVGFAAVQRFAALGPRPLRFSITGPDGQRTVRSESGDTIQIVDANYPIYHLTVPPSSADLLDPVKINQEEAFLNGVYGAWSPQRMWHGAFTAPVGKVEITSDFGERRSINGGPANYWHEGTDFGVWVGTPIQAAADGVVAFAGPLYVRGNVTVIDHGWGIMTGYFHQSEFRVAKGQQIHQGDVIGLSGDTGFVTGPHLHFEVRTRNVWVEPLEWLNWDPFPRPDLANL
jgi:hypothetical protein